MARAKKLRRKQNRIKKAEETPFDRFTGKYIKGFEWLISMLLVAAPPYLLVYLIDRNYYPIQNLFFFIILPSGVATAIFIFIAFTKGPYNDFKWHDWLISSGLLLLVGTLSGGCLIADIFYGTNELFAEKETRMEEAFQVRYWENHEHETQGAIVRWRGIETKVRMSYDTFIELQKKEFDNAELYFSEGLWEIPLLREVWICNQVDCRSFEIGPR